MTFFFFFLFASLARHDRPASPSRSPSAVVHSSAAARATGPGSTAITHSPPSPRHHTDSSSVPDRFTSSPPPPSPSFCRTLPRGFPCGPPASLGPLVPLRHRATATPFATSAASAVPLAAGSPQSRLAASPLRARRHRLPPVLVAIYGTPQEMPRARSATPASGTEATVGTTSGASGGARQPPVRLLMPPQSPPPQPSPQPCTHEVVRLPTLVPVSGNEAAPDAPSAAMHGCASRAATAAQAWRATLPPATASAAPPRATTAAAGSSMPVLRRSLQVTPHTQEALAAMMGRPLAPSPYVGAAARAFDDYLRSHQLVAVVQDARVIDGQSSAGDVARDGGCVPHGRAATVAAQNTETSVEWRDDTRTAPATSGSRPELSSQSSSVCIVCRQREWRWRLARLSGWIGLNQVQR